MSNHIVELFVNKFKNMGIRVFNIRGHEFSFSHQTPELGPVYGTLYNSLYNTDQEVIKMIYTHNGLFTTIHFNDWGKLEQLVLQLFIQ